MHAMGNPEDTAVFVEHESRTTWVSVRVGHMFETGQRHSVARTASRSIWAPQRRQRSMLDDRLPMLVSRQTTKQIFRATFAGGHIHQIKTELALAKVSRLLKACKLDRIAAQPILDVRPILHTSAAILPNDRERISSRLEFGQDTEAHCVLPLLEALPDWARGIVFPLH